MTKYIELEAAYKFMFDIPNPNGAGEIEVVSVDDLDSIPAADVVPVRHGRWLYFLSSWENIEYLQCSICKKNIKGKYKYKYCPNCGAKMKGDRE